MLRRRQWVQLVGGEQNRTRSHPCTQGGLSSYRPPPNRRGGNRARPVVGRRRPPGKHACLQAGEAIALAATASPVLLRPASRARRFGLSSRSIAHWRRNPDRRRTLRFLHLEQPQRLELLSVCPSLGGSGLRLPLRTPGLTPGRGTGSRVSRVPGLALPPGSRPFDHRRDLLR